MNALRFTQKTLSRSTFVSLKFQGYAVSRGALVKIMTAEINSVRRYNFSRCDLILFEGQSDNVGIQG
jgi:hypothetical protein